MNRLKVEMTIYLKGEDKYRNPPEVIPFCQCEQCKESRLKQRYDKPEYYISDQRFFYIGYDPEQEALIYDDAKSEGLIMLNINQVEKYLGQRSVSTRTGRILTMDINYILYNDMCLSLRSKPAKGYLTID